MEIDEDLIISRLFNVMGTVFDLFTNEDVQNGNFVRPFPE